MINYQTHIADTMKYAISFLNALFFENRRMNCY